MRWFVREYVDRSDGQVTSRYVSLDQELWVPAFTKEEMDAREEARRSILRDKDSTDQA